MTDYNNGFWHVWQGGKCPVHPKSVVSVCTIDPHKGASNGKGLQPASEYHWDHENTMFPIVAFRVVKEYREPREFWVFPGGRDVLTAKPAVGGDHYIHVREVMEGGDA